MTSESEGTVRIPPEIITAILYRLPLKSLGRFSCVSKDWLSQISQPLFIKTHQNTHKQVNLIFVSNNRSLYSLPFHHHEPESLTPKKIRFESHHIDVDFTFCGSCNGLVLLSAHDYDGVDRLVVLNPATREFLELQESCYEVMTKWSEIELMYGFGYDSLSDDYKAVSISYFHNNYLIPPDSMCVHVYSLRANTWRRVADSPYDHSYGRSVPGVFVNGFLHWIVDKGSDLLPLIVAFSLADEKLSEVPSPDLSNDCKLVVLGGKLAIFPEGEVWLMEEYGVKESWTKIYHGLAGVEPVILDDKGKMLLVSRDLFFIYDVVERSLCRTIDVSQNLKDLKVKGSYVDSLVSPRFSS